MTFQRFQNFQIGALDAGRLNQMLDSITRLEQRVAYMAQPYEPTKDVILARVTGTGTAAAFDQCQGGVRCVSYPFEEVGLTIGKEGPITDEVCVLTDPIEGGLTSRNGAFLLMLEESPSLVQGDVVKANLASRGASGSAEDKAMVYIGSPVAQKEPVVTGVVLGASGTGYVIRVDGSGERIEVNNLYESEVYYGALDQQPECASISPLPIPDGSRIWAFRYRSEWFTCIPTPFSVACTCNDDTTGVGAARALASLESKAASAMLDLGRSVY